ncbi:hypothetical protein SMGD1_2054 [Sulfurimonas gotlandica GD1]|uniref:Uncharacterized protein n=1 Tax=Sulfurimonas gotlandica (strain DSM 19862 / JCM 16533 / GD1) TaxID=929558 RepID=B6BJ62_SULGG|nr:hypothetical protein [Sulfurimonas gotlandica]EDZ63133.1 hypothetical protein CBGD1_752 [Sulfurimonas gotlandica GD1]EHP30577.1 hypothetical protein SMGD1_2054 [Sulfurimonas gotlandica GD1]
MFKALKYLLLANLYSRAKRSFIALFISVVSLILITFIMGDIISVSSGVSLYSLIIAKWFIVLAVLGFIVFNILKIINIATSPFTKETTVHTVVTSEVDMKREKILNKEKLFTKSDSILKKYIKAQ